jgi:hypothetical protein
MVICGTIKSLPNIIHNIILWSLSTQYNEVNIDVKRMQT